MSEKFEIRFSVQAEPGSPEFELLSYFKNPKQTLFPFKDMAMLALISVWLPLAYRDRKRATPKQLHQVIRDCTHRLMMQLQYFREMDEMAQEQNQLEASSSNGKLIKPSEPSSPTGEDETQYDPDDLFNN